MKTLANIKLKQFKLGDTRSLQELMRILQHSDATITVKVLRKGLIHVKAAAPKPKTKKRKRKASGPDTTASFLPQLF